MRRITAVLPCVAIISVLPAAGIASADMKVTYVGGTVDSVKPGLHGRLTLQDSKELIFRYTKSDALRIPYSAIAEMSLGQLPGHIPASRIAMAAAIGVPGALLLRRKSQNYLTISYVNSSGNKAVAALDLSKGDLWIAIPILEARTGRKVVRNDKVDSNVGSPPTSSPRPLAVAATGTAFAVSGDGFFLTNSHVVAGCKEVVLRGIGDSSQKASVWAQDPVNDLALLKTPDSAAPVLRFADSNQLRLGQSVVVIGYPLSGTLASGIKVTTGTVSSLAGMYDDTRMVQVSAPIQPGNSGGPVFDEAGSVIGVIRMTLDTVGQAQETGKIPQNMNFAIKASIARVFLESNNVRYATGQTGNNLAATRIAETAGPSVMLTECWK